MPLERTFKPWVDRLAADAGGLALFDAHTHVGANDPDGFKQSTEELLTQLELSDCRALVFPMHEPDGYTAANDVVIAAAHEHPDRLRALCRVDPNDGDAAVAEARRALDAGASGIKLHPRAEGFTMSHPTVEALVTLAGEREGPVLIHAGRGIPALGEDTVRLSAAHPGAKLILAHAAISDLSWIWRSLAEHRNLYVDTAWWNPVDLVALFALAPPGQVLWASDSPYGHPAAAAMQGLRCAVQAGLDPEQVRAVAGGQIERLLDRRPPLDLGPAPGPPSTGFDPLLERVVSGLTATIGRLFVRADHAETLALSRLACEVAADEPCAPVCEAVLELLDLYEQHVGPPPPGRPIPEATRYLVAALFVARTPDVPLP